MPAEAGRAKALQKSPVRVSRARWFFYLFALIALAFVLYSFPEIRKSFRLLQQVNSYWLVAAAVLQISSYWLTAMVYRVLLGAFGVHNRPTVKELGAASVIALFFNQTIPSASVSGNTFLFHYLQKKAIASPLILSLILTELLTYYAAMELLVLLFLSASAFLSFPGVLRGVFIGGLVVYVLFAAGVILMNRKSAVDWLYKKLGRSRWFKGLVADSVDEWNSQDFVEIFSFVKTRKLALAQCFFLQLLLYAVDVFTIASLFAGLGLAVPLWSVALALMGTRIVSILPFSPGSLILFESSMTFFFVSLGLAVGPALIVTLLFRLLSFWLPMPAGLLFYRQWSHKHGSH